MVFVCVHDAMLSLIDNVIVYLCTTISDQMRKKIDDVMVNKRHIVRNHSHFIDVTEMSPTTSAISGCEIHVTNKIFKMTGFGFFFFSMAAFGSIYRSGQ